MSTPALHPEAVPAPVRAVCSRLAERGHGAWVVGGCVRDLLRGAEVADWDICTTARPEQVRRAFRRTVPTGLQHGTVTVLHEGEGYEVTTLRGEGAYSDGRRPDEVFFVDDVVEDLARRDFTVNAIAYDPLAGDVVDPHGGQRDLEARVIRAVGVPAERFAEDGLRVLRGARFVATLAFRLEAETRAAIPGALDVFAQVSKERVREEWLKTVRKAPVASPAFRTMADTGILARSCPLLDALRERQPAAFEAALAALDATADGDPAFRLAALFHPLADQLAALEAWLRDYRFSNEERKRVLHLVEHGRPEEARATGSAADLRRWLMDIGPGSVGDVLALARAVAPAPWLDTLAARADAEIQAGHALAVGDLAVGGHDVMQALGGRGGRRVGELLRRLLDEVVEAPERNTAEVLRARLQELAAPEERAGP
ncbi:MAG: hypothetical protein AAF447_03540 [Myxococcota bacterium]